MENKKKALIALGVILVIVVIVTCISKFTAGKGATKDDASTTKTETLAEQVNSGTDTEKETEPVVEDIEEEDKDNRPESFDAVKILHANEDRAYITSEDLYNHMGELVGYNFLTTAKVDKLTDKEVTLILKDGSPSVAFNTAEDYSRLVHDGDEVAVIGTLRDYEEVDNKKIAVAWVSFLASGENDVNEYKEKITNPSFTDLFK